MEEGMLDQIDCVVLGLNVLILLANLAVLGLCFKLYTEFAKQRMQEIRKENP